MAFTNSRGRTQTSLADINVTPLVDVVLVLLIIFMVTAPILQSGIEVAIPHTRTVKEITEERLVITIDRDQRVFLNNEPININQIGDSVAPEDPRPRGPVGLRARRRKCTLWRIRDRDGCREAVGHHQRKHRDSTAGEEWQPTLTSFRPGAIFGAPLIGSVTLHVALFALALFGYLIPSSRGENWGGTGGNGGAMSATLVSSIPLPGASDARPKTCWPMNPRG